MYQLRLPAGYFHLGKEQKYVTLNVEDPVTKNSSAANANSRLQNVFRNLCVMWVMICPCFYAVYELHHCTFGLMQYVLYGIPV